MILNLSNEPPASSKAPNQALNDMDVLCTFKIKIDGKNMDHGCIIESEHIEIKINVPNFSEKPPTSAKAPNQNLKDINVLCNLKIKL